MAPYLIGVGAVGAHGQRVHMARQAAQQRVFAAPGGRRHGLEPHRAGGPAQRGQQVEVMVVARRLRQLVGIEQLGLDVELDALQARARAGLRVIGGIGAHAADGVGARGRQDQVRPVLEGGHRDAAAVRLAHEGRQCLRLGDRAGAHRHVDEQFAHALLRGPVEHGVGAFAPGVRAPGPGGARRAAAHVGGVERGLRGQARLRGGQGRRRAQRVAGDGELLAALFAAQQDRLARRRVQWQEVQRLDAAGGDLERHGAAAGVGLARRLGDDGAHARAHGGGVVLGHGAGRGERGAGAQQQGGGLGRQGQR